MHRVHVVGAPRTGTTLMMLALSHGFDFDHAPAEETSVSVLPPAGTRCSLTKMSRELVLAEPLLALDANQWFVYTVRDPRDVVVSKHQRAPEFYWINLAYVRLSRQRIRGALGHPRLLEVRYEDLVRDPDALQARIAERLPFLQRKGSFSQFHRGLEPSEASARAMNGVRPIDGDSVGAWRRHKPRLVQQMKWHGSFTPDLVELGYEPDASWEQELAGVEADRGMGFWGERTELAKNPEKLWEDFESYVRARGFTPS